MNAFISWKTIKMHWNKGIKVSQVCTYYLRFEGAIEMFTQDLYQL